MNRRIVTVLLGVCLWPAVLAAQPMSATDAQAWREDLRFMAQAMEKTHKNLYHAISRAEFAAMVDALDARIPTLARHEVIVELAKIVAAVGDGHTNIYPTRDVKIGFHTLPVAFTFFGGLYVRAAHESQRDLAGARVLRIGDRSITEAYASVRTMIGKDNDHGAHYWAQFLLSSPEVLHAFRITSTPDEVPLTLATTAGERHVVLRPLGLVDIMTGDTVRAFDRRPGWIDARGNEDALWLRRTDEAFWFERAGRLLYVRINRIQDGASETMAHFSERLRDEIARTAPEKVALDLRLNRGGNGGLNAALVRALIQSPRIDQKGRLFAITGPATFSAAQMLVDALARYTNVTFVGEPTGSKGNAYGDSRIITLPNSGITVRASVYYWQDWHPLDTRDATTPSLPAPMTFEAYRTNRDPALDAIERAPALPEDK